MTTPYQRLLEAVELELEESAPAIGALVRDVDSTKIHVAFPGLVDLILYSDGTWKVV